MDITGKFIVTGYNLYDKRVYACGDGKWSEKKSEAKVFKVGEPSPTFGKGSNVVRIKIEWV